MARAPLPDLAIEPLSSHHDRFGFTSLAEGIETEAQALWLLAHGCRIGQGYLFAEPCSYDKLLELLLTPLAAA